MRRSATVTISVPLASIAAASRSRLVKPPVPRMSRDVNVRLASDERVGGGRGHARQPPCTAVTTSTCAPSATTCVSHAPRGTTSASTATATPRPSGRHVERREQRARPWCRPATLARLAVDGDHAGASSSSSTARLGRQRREQDPVAEVAGGDDRAAVARATIGHVAGRTRAAGRPQSPRRRARRCRARARSRRAAARRRRPR